MNPYLAFTVAAAITYLLRSSMTLAGDRLARSDRLTVVTTRVTPAVLAAMITSALATDHGRFAGPSLAEVIAVSVGFATARKVGNFGLALAAGMTIYWLARLAGLS